MWCTLCTPKILTSTYRTRCRPHDKSVKTFKVGHSDFTAGLCKGHVRISIDTFKCSIYVTINSIFEDFTISQFHNFTISLGLSETQKQNIGNSFHLFICFSRLNIPIYRQQSKLGGIYNHFP